MSRSARVADLVLSPIELFASVALPEIPFPCFLVLFPFPIVSTATGTAGTLFELPSNRVIPVLREPPRIAFPYYSSRKDGPRDSMTCRIIELASESPIPLIAVADKGMEAASMHTSQAAS